MQVIRDEETFGLMMIPLFFDWGIRRCNMKDCTNKPSTIVTDVPDVPIFGLCEEHYQQGEKNGTLAGTLIFDNFDAFEEKKNDNS